MRALHLILLLLLVIFARETHAGAVSAGNSGADFHLKGVLVSQNSRSALVNSTVLREGGQVDGIEILAIREGEVRIRRGLQQLTVPVGTRARWDLATRYTPSTPAARVVRSNAADSYGPVQSGETLSEIAEQHLVGDVTRHQMIVALYDANRDAFDGNINRLREGAILQIPARDVIDRQAPTTAVAEVVRQTAEWRGRQEPQIQLVEVPAPEVYGPVTRGQTLSGIALSLSRDGTTMNQMMVALFETNPQAFGGNINVLREGAVLQLPDAAALRRHSHETATATVVQHSNVWRHGSVYSSMQSRL